MSEGHYKYELHKFAVFRIHRNADLLVLNDTYQELRNKGHPTELCSKPSPYIHMPQDIRCNNFNVCAISSLYGCKAAKLHITTRARAHARTHTPVHLANQIHL